MKTPRLILASSSPRRIQMLRAAGYQPTIVSPSVDESPLPGEQPVALVKRLAKKKAQSVAELRKTITSPEIIVAADTIVVLPSGQSSRMKILGKPSHSTQARAMLRSISGKTHFVYTAYCLIVRAPRSKPILITRVVKTIVTMRKMNKNQIQQYVASGEPADKAGAYAAQGFGMFLIEKISGSYTNVIGLPMAEVLTDLEAFSCGPR